MRGGTTSAVCITGAVFGLALGACTSFESAYEKSVTDYEPIYCYRTLGGTDCYRSAYRRDDRRLVNYYGPAPSKYDPPDPPEMAELQPPPKIHKAAYREPEPGPQLPAAQVPAPATEAKNEESTGSDWKAWLPFLSVGFGALQVVAAFLM